MNAFLDVAMALVYSANVRAAARFRKGFLGDKKHKVVYAAMVIWITGLSGAGKSTLCDALRDLLKPRLPELAVLDGDVIRATFGADLSYREEDRVVQIKRLQGMARVLSEQGMVVIVAALYAHPDLLRWNRENFASYFEIYIEASLDLVAARDAKGLYAAAAAGRMTDVVGVDIPWQAPEHADLVVEAASGESPVAVAERVAAALPRLAAALPSAAQ